MIKRIFRLFNSKESLKIIKSSSLIALIISIIICPFWYQVFAFKDLQVEVSLQAPNSEYIKVYWNNPQAYPNAYKKILVNPVKSKSWDISIEPLAKKNPLSAGYEIQITDINTPQTKVDWNQVFTNVKGTEWQLVNFQWSSQKKSLLWNNSQNPASPLDIQLEGGDLTLSFQRSPRSGMLKIKANNKSEIVDLFSHRFLKSESITFPANALGNEEIKSYKFTIPYDSWQKIQFISDDNQPLFIKQIKVNNQNISDLNSDIIVLPFFSIQFWNSLVYTIISSLISFIWMTLLFISIINIWQGRKNQKLGLISYIILVSIAVSGFWLLVVYPAVMTPDTLSQWQQALRNKYEVWHPPILAILMHLTQYFVKTPSLLILLQGSIFWGAIIYLIYQVTNNSKTFLIGSSFIILLFPLWLYSGTIVSNTWMTAFALLSAAFLIRAKYKQRKISFILSIIFLSVAVMFRREVALLFIILIFMYFFIYWRQQKLYQRIIICCLIPILILLPARILLYLPNINAQRDFPFGQLLLHQYVGTIINSEDKISSSQISSEKQEIDKRFGDGTFQRFIDHYICYSENYIRIYQPQESPLLGNRLNDEDQTFILNKYTKSLSNYPLGFLKHKMCNFAYVLQVPNLGYEGWTLLENWPAMEAQLNQLGIQSNSRFPSIMEWYKKTLINSFDHPILSLLFRHYIFLIITLLITIISLIYKKEKLSITGSFALVYALAHLIADSYGHWRYLLLSYIFCWITIIATIDILTSPKVQDSVLFDSKEE
ncbi:MAG TPA: hypothetical protein DCF68_01545 [Cyanothece sp. UBA12306]|nr:hypothetical protein [Cyanothece sp. UBA12306]